MNDDPSNAGEESVTPQPEQLAVVFIGALEDCKGTMAFLTEHGVPAVLHVAELIRPDLRARGYYLVATTLADGEHAKALIEEHFHRTFNISATTPNESEPERCPACGALLPAGCAACPDCGLTFT